jgi:hypothetical protein
MFHKSFEARISYYLPVELASHTLVLDVGPAGDISQKDLEKL